MPVQTQVTIISPGDSLSELLNQLEKALADSGLTIAPESLVNALKAALAECEARTYTDEDVAALDALKKKLDQVDPVPA